jgi:hypothetical protein
VSSEKNKKIKIKKISCVFAVLWYSLSMKDKNLADWLARRLNRCLTIDNWQRDRLEKFLKTLRKKIS